MYRHCRSGKMEGAPMRTCTKAHTCTCTHARMHVRTHHTTPHNTKYTTKFYHSSAPDMTNDNTVTTCASIILATKFHNLFRTCIQTHRHRHSINQQKCGVHQSSNCRSMAKSLHRHQKLQLQDLVMILMSLYHRASGKKLHDINC